MRGFYRARGKSWAIGPLRGWRLQGLHASVPVVFSEREGYRRFPLRVGAWRIGITKDRPVFKVQIDGRQIAAAVVGALPPAVTMEQVQHDRRTV